MPVEMKFEQQAFPTQRNPVRKNHNRNPNHNIIPSMQAKYEYHAKTKIVVILMGFRADTNV